MCIGGMAYTFMKIVHNMPIGTSLFDKKGAELVPALMAKAKAKGCEIILPCDWKCGKEFKNDQETIMTTDKEGIPDGWEGMDCGPKSMALFREKILSSKTVIWNGPALPLYPTVSHLLPSSPAGHLEWPRGRLRV